MDDCCGDMSDYEILAEIGQGAYGKVYKAREKRDRQRLVAVKRLNISEDPDTGIPQFMIREVALLRKLEHFNHPNIVKLLNVSAGWQNQIFDLTLVFECIDQDLSTFLSKASEEGLARDTIKDVMRQLLSGLDFLHTNTVIHRDLKPENVLVVTLWYRAPEVLLHSSYMSSVDMWSAGCIFAELFLLRPLFCGYTEIQQLQKIFEVIGVPGEEDWPMESAVCYSPVWAEKKPTTQILPSLTHEEHDLLSQCLTFSPAHRISAYSALAHPYLADP
ncbi:cyclin-dependent kinase 6 isoform X2 [Misgurnus anguillicaudatus]|uniref:cyclin-dependent kinase 6 isoform X2 n=1 Tax=Misgurnus anguillicaudatus TaxID=75329 RepID=UPI003CCF9D3F